jgi:hypothetical protein
MQEVHEHERERESEQPLELLLSAETRAPQEHSRRRPLVKFLLFSAGGCATKLR